MTMRSWPSQPRCRSSHSRPPTRPSWTQALAIVTATLSHLSSSPCWQCSATRHKGDWGWPIMVRVLERQARMCRGHATPQETASAPLQGTVTGGALACVGMRRYNQSMLVSRTHALHHVRNVTAPDAVKRQWTIESNIQLVTGAGWRWCALPKDSWLCWGESYRNHLASSRQLHQAAAISRFPRGSRVFLQGNSHFAESILSLVRLCMSCCCKCHGLIAASAWIAASSARNIV